MEAIHSGMSVSVTELKRNFASVLATAQNTPIAVLNHNKPEAYLLSAKQYEKLLEILEDVQDRQMVEERKNGPFVEAAIDEL